MAILTLIALLVCGFSVFSGVILLATQFQRREGGLFGVILLLAIMLLQFSHAWRFVHAGLPSETLYIAALYFIAPAFFLFVQAQLLESPVRLLFTMLHFTPVLLAFLLPDKIAVAMAFLIGGGYIAWLFRLIYSVREQREMFTREALFLGVALLLGMMVFVLGLSMPLLDELAFYLFYAIGIGGLFFFVHLALLWNPHLQEEVSDAARQAYTTSTLTAVDCQAKLALLENLMQEQQLYQEPDMKLANLAERLDLSAHQLSELINTHRGMHFSRFLRQYRVDAAKQRLLEKPSLSVLEVGMGVGFSSQSTFYEAFRDLTGTTPAKFRKINL